MDEGTYLRKQTADKNVWEKTWRSELPFRTIAVLNDGNALFGRLRSGTGSNPTEETISLEIVREWADRRQADNSFFKAVVGTNSSQEVIDEVLRHHGSVTGEAVARSVARANMRRAERQQKG